MCPPHSLMTGRGRKQGAHTMCPPHSLMTGRGRKKTGGTHYVPTPLYDKVVDECVRLRTAVCRHKWTAPLLIAPVHRLYTHVMGKVNQRRRATRLRGRKGPGTGLPSSWVSLYRYAMHRAADLSRLRNLLQVGHQSRPRS